MFRLIINRYTIYIYFSKVWTVRYRSEFPFFFYPQKSNSILSTPLHSRNTMRTVSENKRTKEELISSFSPSRMLRYSLFYTHGNFSIYLSRCNKPNDHGGIDNDRRRNTWFAWKIKGEKIGEESVTSNDYKLFPIFCNRILFDRKTSFYREIQDALLFCLTLTSLDHRSQSLLDLTHVLNFRTFCSLIKKRIYRENCSPF